MVFTGGFQALTTGVEMELSKPITCAVMATLLHAKAAKRRPSEKSDPKSCGGSRQDSRVYLNETTRSTAGAISRDTSVRLGVRVGKGLLITTAQGSQ
jgi:hypothetical protein